MSRRDPAAPTARGDLVSAGPAALGGIEVISVLHGRRSGPPPRAITAIPIERVSPAIQRQVERRGGLLRDARGLVAQQPLEHRRHRAVERGVGEREHRPEHHQLGGAEQPEAIAELHGPTSTSLAGRAHG